MHCPAPLPPHKALVRLGRWSAGDCTSLVAGMIVDEFEAGFLGRCGLSWSMRAGRARPSEEAVAFFRQALFWPLVAHCAASVMSANWLFWGYGIPNALF